MELILSTILDISNNICIFLYMLYQYILYTVIAMIYFQETQKNIGIIYNVCEKNINNVCKNTTYDISWKVIGAYTMANEVYRKQIVPSFHSFTYNYFKTEIILTKDGNEIYHLSDWELYKNHKDKDFDMLLYTKFHDTEDKKNYTIIGDNNFILNDNNHSNICSVNFIIFQLSYDNQKYDINLKEPFNFLLKNNTLKHSFFKWYMKKIYDVDIELHNYSVNYMTQDMSTSNLHSPFFIKFNEDSITSFSSGKPKKEEENIEEHISNEEDQVSTEDDKNQTLTYEDNVTEDEDNITEDEDNVTEDETNISKNEDNVTEEDKQSEDSGLEEIRKTVLLNDIVKSEKLKRRTRDLV